MSKRTTRLGLGAAVLVAVGAVATGAAASADALPESPSGEVVSANVLEVGTDGTVIECEVEGSLAAGAALAVPTGDGAVSEAVPSGGAVGWGEVVPSEGAIAVEDLPELLDGEATEAEASPEGDAFVIGSTGPDGKIIARGGPEDIRTGTPEECERITAAVGTGG